MITYFSGSTFNQIIQGSIAEMDQMVFEPHIDDNQDFYKCVKQNIISFEGIDYFIVDISSCMNTDGELLAGFEMVRTMYDRMRIIVFAPYRETGDVFLTKCLEMGITNIINTDDFNEIRDALKHCIKTGMTYREAVKYKEAKQEKLSIKHAIKKTVNRHMVGMAGCGGNIGTTHHVILLANYFRKMGFMVAAAEMNRSKAFDSICEGFEETYFEEGYFTLEGVDYYPAVDKGKLAEIQMRSYNIILLDFGAYAPEMKDAFERCEDRIVIAGSKPWELEAVDAVFGLASKDVLLKYIFCFNFTQEKEQEAIRKGMGELHRVYFLNYTQNPFMESDFASAEEIFAEILPDKPKEEKKKGLTGKLFGKKQKKAGEKKKTKNEEKRKNRGQADPV